MLLWCVWETHLLHLIFLKKNYLPVTDITGPLKRLCHKVTLIFPDRQVFHVHCALKSPLAAASDGVSGGDVAARLPYGLQFRGAREARISRTSCTRFFSEHVNRISISQASPLIFCPLN